MPTQPAAVAADARPRVAVGPAEALGALAQAGDEVPGREAVAGLRIDLRLVADPQLDRVDAGTRSRARPSPTRARTCPGTRRARASTTASGTSRRDEAVRRPPRRRGVHHPRHDRGLLRELLDRRRLLDDVVGDRDEPPVAVGAEPEPLDRRRAVAGEREHLLPRDGELHRPADVPRRDRRERSRAAAACPSSRSRRRRAARSRAPSRARARAASRPSAWYWKAPWFES